MPDEPDTWDEMTAPAQEGDSTTQQTVAGREATVHVRVVKEPLSGFLTRVVFPDAVIELTGYGLDEELARQALEALRAL
jgi:hypothetical protein